MFETFDHTADLGLRMRAGSLNELFSEAARALMSILVENSEAIEPKRELQLSIAGTDVEYLLFDWLKELLYRFEVEHTLFCKFDVAVTGAGLTAVVHGEVLDRARHRLEHEVKAITLHGLKVEHHDDGWLAEVIVDI